MPIFTPPQFGKPLFEAAQNPEEQRYVHQSLNDYVRDRLAAPAVQELIEQEPAIQPLRLEDTLTLSFSTEDVAVIGQPVETSPRNGRWAIVTWAARKFISRYLCAESPDSPKVVRVDQPLSIAIEMNAALRVNPSLNFRAMTEAALAMGIFRSVDVGHKEMEAITGYFDTGTPVRFP